MDVSPFVRFVRPTREPENQPHEFDVEQLCFQIDATRRLRLGEGALDGAVLDMLGHRIRDNPGDLRSHTRRILLLIERAEASALYGAMADLYIVLGSHGQALKKRLYHLAEPRLSRTAAAFLKKTMGSGIQPWDMSIAHLRTSLLCLCYTGVCEVVHRAAADARAGYANALEEAAASLEYGQVDEAREVLEKALREDPYGDEVAEELLKIYQGTRDEKSFARMRSFFRDSQLPVPDSWPSDLIA